MGDQITTNAQTPTAYGEAALRARIDRGHDEAQASAHSGVLRGDGKAPWHGGRASAFQEASAVVSTNMRCIGWRHRHTGKIRDDKPSGVPVNPAADWDPIYVVARFVPGYA